jgi:hypothetical protein
MQQTHIRINRNINRRGLVGLFIVFILVLGVLVLIMKNYSESFVSFSLWKGSEYNRYAAPDAKPWEEEKLIWGKADGYDMNPRRPPFSGQPKVANMMTYEVNLMDDGKPMGTLVISVLNDFDAIAVWKGEFDLNGKHYKAEQWPDPYTKQPMNVFHGNINPLKIYQDSKGKDRKKLYFITRGYYQLRGTEEKDTRGDIAYVNGWMNKDFSAEGTLSIPRFDKDQELIIKWGPLKGQGK